jgi:hypothetical protein
MSPLLQPRSNTVSIIRTIPQKPSGTGCIHDLSSNLFDREIVFGDGDRYAVVLAAHYGGRGYTTHSPAEDAAAASVEKFEYSHRIIDVDSCEWDCVGYGRLQSRGFTGVFEETS